jgi:uncharacterized protein (TIGR03086 family)
LRRENTVEVVELHHRAVDGFGRRVAAVQEEQWDQDTALPGWDVRTLVNHLVNESKWTAPLLTGSRIEDIGDRFDGDLLGNDPKAAWDESAAEAKAAVNEESLDRTVHLSFGDAPGREYVMQLFADYLIHSWDLARAINGDDKLEPELVEACGQWFSSVENDYRSAGAIGEAPEIPQEADPQRKLLARFGRKA